MLKIGLTGGIGSGKTTVLNLFKQAGVAVISLDAIAKQLTQPDSPACQTIRKHFGEQFFTPDGQLKRAALRKQVFAHPKSRRWLENLLHPLIKAALYAKFDTLNAPCCLIEIPLLVETDFQTLVDRILVIDCPEQTQIDRIQKRDGTSTEIIQAIIDTQATRKERLAVADDLIKNTGSLDALKTKVAALTEYYQTLSPKINDKGSV